MLGGLLRRLSKAARRHPVSAFCMLSGSCTLLGVVLFRFYAKSPDAARRHLVSFTQLLRLLQDETADVHVHGNTWIAVPRPELPASGSVAAVSDIYLAHSSPEIVAAHQRSLDKLLAAGKLDMTHSPKRTASPLQNFLFVVLSSGAAAVVAGLALRLFMPGAGGNNDDSWRPFSKTPRAARSNTPAPALSFSGIAGLADCKRELAEPVAYLQAAQRSRPAGAGAGAGAGSGSVSLADLGGRPPRGVLLAGPPGCGKTMLARAVAGEAGVPFFAVSGSEFVELFVGRGAARVRDLFRRARRCAPCVVFIDELDALGKRRGGPLANDEREATLNQVLVELDGLASGGARGGAHRSGGFVQSLLGDSDSDSDSEEDNGAGSGGGALGTAGGGGAAARAPRVLVLAATNRADVLDAALVRPGRFDRVVHVPLPDTEARGGVLDMHMGRLRWDSPAAWAGVRAQLVANTRGVNGAQLEAIANETAVMAQRRGARAVSKEDAVAAMEKVLAMARAGRGGDGS